MSTSDAVPASDGDADLDLRTRGSANAQDYEESVAAVGDDNGPFIVVVGSVPPPVAGQSLATAHVLEYLHDTGSHFQVVDIAEQVTYQSPWQVVRRALFVLSLPVRVALAGRKSAGRRITLYIQLGGSRSAMMRDLPLLLLARFSHWRIVGHFHSRQWPTALGRLPTPLRTAVVRATGWCDALVVLTPNAREMLSPLAAGDQQEIHVVRNRIDHDLQLAATRSTKPPPAGKPTVLFLGNLVAGKGLALLSDIAREAERRGHAFRFVVAGSGDESLLGTDLPDSVEPIGFVEGPAKVAVLRDADVLLLPTMLEEGEPLSVIEAYWFGVPVVASAVGGLVDLVDDSTGRLVAQGDRNGFVDALVDILDPATWSRLSDSCRQRAQRDHSVAAHRKTLTKIILQ